MDKIDDYINKISTDVWAFANEWATYFAKNGTGYVEQLDKDREFAQQIQNLITQSRIDELENLDRTLSKHHSEALRSVGLEQHPNEVYPYREDVTARIKELGEGEGNTSHITEEGELKNNE